MKFKSETIEIRLPGKQSTKGKTNKYRILKEYKTFILMENIDNGMKESFLKADLQIWKEEGRIKEC